MTAPRWHAVDVDREDISEVRTLFAEVFGQGMSEEVWRWKYADGRGAGTGARDEGGRLLAHYGGTARTLVVQDKCLAAVQMGDVMVIRHARGILSRRGPFATAANAFISRNVGLSGRFALGFGFPSARHARLGEALGIYHRLGEVMELTWPRAPAKFQFKLNMNCTAVDWQSPATPPRLDDLWKEFRADAPYFVLPKRDGDWWRHRYANHPEGRYRCWWIRSPLTRRITGALALRPNGDSWELLDWLAPPRALPQLLACARSLAAQAGAQLHGWFGAALIDMLTDADPTHLAIMQKACDFCVTIQRAPHVPADLLDRPWWITGGDTDFR